MCSSDLQTATEHNRAYFQVDKSRDGMNWQVLSTVDAAGNSTELLNYSAMDANALEGNNYYRLTQVDIDGTSKEYGIINVSCSGTSKGYFSAYPNPSTDGIYISINDLKLTGESQIRICDLQGKEIFTQNVFVKPGENLFRLYLPNMEQGTYFIYCTNSTNTTPVIKQMHRY